MKSRGMRFIFIVLCLFIVFGTGCANKETVKPDAGIQEDKAAAEQKLKDEAEARARAEAERQKALQEEALRRQAEKGGDAVVSEVAALTDIFYDYDKYAIRSEDRDILKKNSEWILKNNPGTVIIEGHCDERGTTEYNLALGERRAAEAKKYLIELGVAKNKLKTVSYGKERPLDPGHNDDAWSKNRRSHFVVESNNK